MSSTENLLVATLLVPLIMLIASVPPRWRKRVSDLLALAPIPALMTALLAQDDTILTFPAPFSITLTIDQTSRILLGVIALLWIAAGVYASTYLRDKSESGRFASWWLLTLIGNLGVFITADIVSFYLAFALVSLSAYGLIAFDGSERARRAGFVYIALGILGEAALLLGFVRLALGSPDGSLLIRDVVASLPSSPWRDSTLAFLIFGCGLKIGLVPLHVWIPLAHSEAPMPVSVVLSGAVVKAGVIGLIRFLPFEAALPDWGNALAALGLFTALYGVGVGLTQTNPKSVLAYSTLSQMGVVAAAIGMGLAAGDVSAAAHASFYAAHHVLAKGALFFAVGVIVTAAPVPRTAVLIISAVLGLGLAGLPFTGGALAKAAVKPELGYGVAGVFATLSAIGTAMLMLHFLRCLAVPISNVRRKLSAGLVLPWLIVSAASVILPWMLFASVMGGDVTDQHSLYVVWESLWPVLVGAGLAFVLRDWLQNLPRLPIGDIAALFKKMIPAATRLSGTVEQIETRLRDWSVAVLSLLIVTVMLGVALMAGH
jgi:formate hydrogenlyase subunit 3/multisubunit Na+/H+ antiporter MnhD subunit